MMITPETQVAFNLKKGSLPVRGDVDLAAANDCMKKGLDDPRGGQRRHVRPNELITPGHQHADRGPDDRVLQRHEHHARGRAGALRRDHRQRRLSLATPTGRRTRSGGRRTSSAVQGGSAAWPRNASEPALPEPQRQDRLDPDDPDRASCVFLGGTIWTVVYSFTDSKLLPRLRFVGLEQYERLWSHQPLAGLDREPGDLRHPRR